jgi:prolipoprotein diacylglyceryltransferase
MKRMLFIVAGALLFTALGFAIGSIVTNWYSDHFAKSDDDISQSVGYFLLVWPLFAILGGYIGNVLFRQKLTLRSRERTDKRDSP